MSARIAGLVEDLVFTDENHSRHFELNQVLFQAVLTQSRVALVDMPELLLRMKVVSELSLVEVQ